ncbi:toll/interleukin-1 receptor domain-containing protein [Saccharothrix longispora]|nr:toll/interleukin-1 receptor domain-containing protein [Saccharothrix longispora]
MTPSPEDRRALLALVSRVVNHETAARALVTGIGYPPDRLPAWHRPDEWWWQVFADFDDGVLADPYARLIRAVADRLPANGEAARLCRTYFDARQGNTTVTTSPADRKPVFLCHASQDKPAVRALHARLRSDGFDPWLDEEDLLPGQDWDRQIRYALRDSVAVLVLVSAESVVKRGYLQKEIRQVLDIADEFPDGAIFVIPVLLGDVALPDRLARWQAAALFRPDGYDRLLRSLSAVVAATGR